MRVLFLTIVLPLLLSGCGPRAPAVFDGSLAYKHVQAQCNLGPRWVGTPALRATGDYIIAELQKTGLAATTQEFEYKGVPIRNIVTKIAEGRGPVVILGAHYDTRRYADSDPQNKTAPVLGANDGASGVAVLLELARVLDRAKLQNEVWLAFFDAEDQGNIAGWPWSVGARYMAEHLTIRPACVIVVDMIGDADQNIYWERTSDRELQQQIWEIAGALGYGEQFIPQYKHAVLDDHTPFLERGIRAIDIIDLDYPYWHTTQDTPDKVSAASLERVGRVLQELLQKQPHRLLT